MRKASTGPRRRIAQVGWSKVLTQKEQDLLWAYLRGENKSVITGNFIDVNSLSARRLLLMFEIAVSTGLRSLELVQLRVCDTPAVLGENVIEVYKGKGNKDRTIPIDSLLANSLHDYVTNHRPRTLSRHIKRTDISKPIFYGDKKHTYVQRYKKWDEQKETFKIYRRASRVIYVMVREAGEHAGIIKPLHPHMLRHTFAVNALTRGVDIYVLQQLMGHHSITMTARYLHLVSSQLRGLGRKLYCRSESLF